MRQKLGEAVQNRAHPAQKPGPRRADHQVQKRRKIVGATGLDQMVAAFQQPHRRRFGNGGAKARGLDQPALDLRRPGDLPFLEDQPGARPACRVRAGDQRGETGIEDLHLVKEMRGLGMAGPAPEIQLARPPEAVAQIDPGRGRPAAGVMDDRRQAGGAGGGTEGEAAQMRPKRDGAAVVGMGLALDQGAAHGLDQVMEHDRVAPAQAGQALRQSQRLDLLGQGDGLAGRGLGPGEDMQQAQGMIGPVGRAACGFGPGPERGIPGRKAQPGAIAGQRVQGFLAIADQVAFGWAGRGRGPGRATFDQRRGVKAAGHHHRALAGMAGQMGAHLRLARQGIVGLQHRRRGRGAQRRAIGIGIGEETLPVGLSQPGLEQRIPQLKPVAKTQPAAGLGDEIGLIEGRFGLDRDRPARRQAAGIHRQVDECDLGTEGRRLADGDGFGRVIREGQIGGRARAAILGRGANGDHGQRKAGLAIQQMRDMAGQIVGGLDQHHLGAVGADHGAQGPGAGGGMVADRCEDRRPAEELLPDRVPVQPVSQGHSSPAPPARPDRIPSTAPNPVPGRAPPRRYRRQASSHPRGRP